MPLASTAPVAVLHGARAGSRRGVRPRCRATTSTRTRSAPRSRIDAQPTPTPRAPAAGDSGPGAAGRPPRQPGRLGAGPGARVATGRRPVAGPDRGGALGLGAGLAPRTTRQRAELTDGPEAPSRPARSWRTLEPGDVVLVSGELGAGKTTFVRGALRRAGRRRAGHAPTFTSATATTAASARRHLDLYRLAGMGGEDPGLLDGTSADDGSRSSNGPSTPPARWPGERVPLAAARARGGDRAADRGERVKRVGIDTATPATVAGVRSTTEGEVERATIPKPASARATPETLSRCSRGARGGRRRAGTTSRGSASASARAASPGCGSASRPRARRAGARAASWWRLDARGAGARATAERGRRVGWRCSTPGAARCSPPPTASTARRGSRTRAPAALAARLAAAKWWPRTLSPSGTGRYAFGGARTGRSGGAARRLPRPSRRRPDGVPPGEDGEPVDRDALLPDYRREPDAVPPPTR